MHNTFRSLAVALFCFLSASSTVAANYDGVTMDLDGTIHCPMHASRTSFCGGDSNSTDFIIHCHNGDGKISACSLDLVGVQPVGVKYGATCYEESPTAGDAVCIYDGKEYDTYNYKVSKVTTGTATGTEAPPVATVTEDVADYIMEGIRQHYSN
ncbi:hypothetical protein ABW19_dt0204931 [Dactylella cylindrospora]|nr:hypothetical protein ABW19_dt0204931 [Dactylella cylindrospora]